MAIVYAAAAGLVLYVFSTQRRIERRLDRIERMMGARSPDWE